jgi:hypothetical protein
LFGAQNGLVAAGTSPSVAPDQVYRVFELAATKQGFFLLYIYAFAFSGFAACYVF